MDRSIINSAPADTELASGAQVLIPVRSKKTPAEIDNIERVTYILPGGGRMIRHKNGTVVGPIGGEALRLALARGAVVVGDEIPVPTKLGKSQSEQQLDAQAQENAQNAADAKGPYEGEVAVGGGRAVVKAGGGNPWAGAHFVK